jgi:hypothetical protein
MSNRQALFAQLNNFLNSIDQKDYEIEVRVGTFAKDKFNNNIDSKVFYRVLDHFLSHPDIYVIVQDETILKTEEYGDLVNTNTIVELSYPSKKQNVIIRESFVPDQNDKPLGPRFYSTKERVKTIDFVNEYTRVSFAKEQPLLTITNLQEKNTPVSDVNPLAFRKKTRWSFEVINDIDHRLKPFRIDLTKVDGWYIYDSSTSSKNFKKTFEIEMELIKNIKNVEEELWPGVQNILQIIQNTPFIMTLNTLNGIMDKFNVLFADTNVNHIVNKPIDIELETLSTIPNLLTVTDKADGERKLMYIDPKGAFLIYPPKEVYLYMPTKPNDQNKYISPESAAELANTVLDGELVVNKGQIEYLAFDILFYNGTDLRKTPFAGRLETLKKISSNHPVIKMKQFLLPTQGNFFDNVNNILNKIQNTILWTMGNDGLIFNDINTDYHAPVYKWKPPQLLTIDFSVKLIGNGVFELYTKGDRGLELFRGTQKYPFDGKTFNLKAENGQIVELKWNNNTFEQFKIRHDREQPNYTKTAQNVWTHIKSPVLESTIRGHDLILMRKNHNLIKSKLLHYLPNGVNLLDIGSGRGGDIHKWKEIKAHVLAVEPSIEHITDFKQRLLGNGYSLQSNNIYTSVNGTSVEILNTIGQNTNAITSKFKKTKDSSTSIFNALTFFFENKESIEALAKTIDNSVGQNGLFIGMVMDGQKVRDLLGKKDKIVDYGWVIEKKGEFTTEPFGNKIWINLDDTIVVNQIEYLIDWNTFKNTMESIGLFVQETTLLYNKTLSPSASKFNSLYRTFVFKRQSNSQQSTTQQKYHTTKYHTTKYPTISF